MVERSESAAAVREHAFLQGSWEEAQVGWRDKLQQVSTSSQDTRIVLEMGPRSMHHA